MKQSFPAAWSRAGRHFARLALFAAPALLCAAAAPGDRYAHLNGPPAAHTGGFGEPTCTACHSDYPLNDGGSITIEGAPERYEAGKTYRLRVVVRHPELRRAGFQLSARFANGELTGQQAGTLAVADASAAVVDAAGISYVQHTRAGTDVASPGEHAWSITWTAPADGSADVVLHIAANAANDDFSELGDRIHTASVVIGSR